MVNSSNVLTATEIDNNRNNILIRVDEAVMKHVSSFVKRKTRDIRESLKAEFPGQPEKHVVPVETIDKIRSEYVSSQEVADFREYQVESLNSEVENYMQLRSRLNMLNDLNEFSADIEKMGIQVHDGEYMSYGDLIEKLPSFNDTFGNMIASRKETISTMISSFKGKSLEMDELGMLFRLHEMYAIKRDHPDIDLFNKYEFNTNIDYANELSRLYLARSANGNNDSNIINDLVDNRGVASVKSRRNIIGNKLLGMLLSNVDNKFSMVTNNRVTCLSNTYVTDATVDTRFTTRTIGELLMEITSDKKANMEKVDRQQVYMTYDGSRPGTDGYHKWNGLQVFDIDLKEWEGDVSYLKSALHKYLLKFHWYLWTCKSASGKGIHVYTKVSPAHHVYLDLEDNERLSKYWYSVNYMTKETLINDILRRIHDGKSSLKFDDGAWLTKHDNRFIDNSVGRITSGIRLSYDPMPLVNPGFMDLHVSVFLHETTDGVNSMKFIKEVFNRAYKKEYQVERVKRYVAMIDELSIEEDKRDKPGPINLSSYVNISGDSGGIRPLPRNSIKYITRYNVCNTLAAIMGKDGLQVAHVLLDSKGCGNAREINAFYSCALSNKKEPSKLGLNILEKYGVIKNVEPELEKIVEKGFKDDLRTMIMNVSGDSVLKVTRHTINLGEEEYLGDVKKQIMSKVISSKINILLSPAGSGKTEMIKSLARDGKRVMLVLPFISVIKNKVEKDPEILELFACYYGSKDVKTIEPGINAVTTFDKFSRANYEKLSRMYDYIFIDESHLLFTSSYRIEATSNSIRKIKDLFHVSSNDPYSAKLCLMTGTETGETYFFGNVANVITASKKSNGKDMEFMLCGDTLDCTTRVAKRVHDFINEGYKVLIPTNKGEVYSEKIMGMASHILGREVKYGYYKRSNTEQEICRLVNDMNTTGDYEVIFCSNYLSVGVDINDDCKFASIYLGNFSGYEVEQFNARIRKTGIKSVYCVQTENSSGETNDLLLAEPQLVLKITEADREAFLDDKEIASAKQEFTGHYDPVLHKITTPGFSYLHGKIQFNLEEYELVSFETKYVECMQHPVKVARELSNYGYNVSVSPEFNGMELMMQAELKRVGIESAKQEKIRKHTLLVGTFIDLVTKNSHVNDHGLEYHGVIDWMMKNPDLIMEDRDMEQHVEITFDIFSTPTSVKVKSREAFDNMVKNARYLLSRYSPQKAVSIINQYVDDNGVLKQSNFKRSINLLRLVDGADANELSDPLSRTIEKVYEYVDKFELDASWHVSYNGYMAQVDEWTNSYIDMLGIKVNSVYGYEKVRDSIVELINDISSRSKSKYGLRFIYNKIPDQDSNVILNKRSVDDIISRMFKLGNDIKKQQVNKTRTRHVTLHDGGF